MCSSHTFCERSTVILDVFKVIYYLFLPLFFPSIFWKHAGYMWLPWEQKIIFSVENIFWQWVFISQTKGFHLVKHTRAIQGIFPINVPYWEAAAKTFGEFIRVFRNTLSITTLAFSNHQPLSWIINKQTIVDKIKYKIGIVCW